MIRKTGSDKRNIIFIALLLIISQVIPAAGDGNSTILVVTDRYVVLDDPNTGSFSGTGFKNPTNNWGSNVFSGVETTITMWALVIDKNGTPIPNTNVNFTLKNPGNATDYTVNKSTDSFGLVNLSRDLNAKNYYGKWQVIANATSVGINDSSSFIYNWWGCGGGAGCSGHGSENMNSGATVNSPYTTGHDVVVGQRTGDHEPANGCMYCHLSYNGQGSTPTLYPQDVHRNIGCNNSTCHGSFATHRSNMVIGSCNSCHSRTDITDKTTLNGVVSAYSNTSNTAGTYNKYHTPNSTVPCIICHGPMHNISKPDRDNTTRYTKNNDTEVTHCTACHSGYNQHNSSNATSGGVDCTLCHSDDIHAIQVFAQNGTYVTGKTNSARGNCTNCHQNSTFISTLKSQSKAGNYTGRDPPVVQSPMQHSDDTLAGKKWNQTPGYWTNTSQVTWCLYCHGNTSHNSSALGRISLFDGNNIVNSSISTSTSWCLPCHWQGYSSGANNYDSMASTFIADSLKVPPEISDNATYGADKSNPSYFNHSTVDKNDATCRGCHMTLNTGTAISQFMHNVTIGKNCQDCHYSWSLMNGSYNKPLAYVNSTLVNSSVHVNVSCMNCHTYIAGHPDNSTYPKWGWKWCESCHANTQDPQNNISRHLIVSNPRNNLFGGTSVVNITTCTTCHNSTLYNNSKNSFGKDKGIDCNYCHSFPDNSRG